MAQALGRIVFVILLAIGLFRYFTHERDILSLADDAPSLSLKADPKEPNKDKKEFLVKQGSAVRLTPEQKQLFEQVKKEIDFCVEKEFPRVAAKCPQIKKAGKVKTLPEKGCAKEKKLEVGLKCESKLLGRIPYRSRPAWNEYRASKIENDRKKLDKLKGIKSKQKGTVPGDSGWLKEY